MKLRVQACSGCGRMKDHNENLITIGDGYLGDGWTEQVFEVPGGKNFRLLVAGCPCGPGTGGEAGERLLEGINSLLAKDDVSRLFNSGTEPGLRVRQISAELNNGQAGREGRLHETDFTLSGVVWACGRAWLINRGSSGTYIFSDGVLTRLSSDEARPDLSGVREAEDCTGGGAPGAVHIEDVTERMKDGDMILICSDGLTDLVSRDEMEYILSNDFEPAAALVERTGDNGGTGSVSVIVALVGGGEFAPGTACDGFRDDDGRFDAWA